MDHRSQPDDGSTELEALRSVRTDPVPDASIVDAHREAVTTAIGRERISPQRRPARRRMVVAAAVLTALAGGTILAGGAPGPDGDDLGDIELAASNAFYDAPRCGSTPPPDVNIPDGFSGPIDGPSPDSHRPATGDQLVRHWTSPTGSIELRWYADSDATPPAFAEWKKSLPTFDDSGAPIDPTPHPVADGVDDVLVTLGRSAAASERRYGQLVYGTEAGEPDDPCTWVQVTVFDNDPEQVNETLDEATRLCEGEVDIVEVQIQVSPTWDERDDGVVMSMPDVWDDCDN